MQQCTTGRLHNAHLVVPSLICLIGPHVYSLWSTYDDPRPSVICSRGDSASSRMFYRDGRGEVGDAGCTTVRTRYIIITGIITGLATCSVTPSAGISPRVADQRKPGPVIYIRPSAGAVRVIPSWQGVQTGPYAAHTVLNDATRSIEGLKANEYRSLPCGSH